MVEDPGNRRKLQNRQAQRAFRDRRAHKVQDLTDELDTQKTNYESQINDLKNELHQQKRTSAERYERIQALERKCKKLERDHEQHLQTCRLRSTQGRASNSMRKSHHIDV